MVRYEFLKQRTSYLRADVQHCQAERLSLTLALVRLRTERDSIQASLNRTQTQQKRKRKLLRHARLENWSWRGLAAFTLYLTLRSW